MSLDERPEILPNKFRTSMTALQGKIKSTTKRLRNTERKIVLRENFFYEFSNVSILQKLKSFFRHKKINNNKSSFSQDNKNLVPSTILFSQCVNKSSTDTQRGSKGFLFTDLTRSLAIELHLSL